MLSGLQVDEALRARPRPAWDVLSRRLRGPYGEVVPHGARPHWWARARGLRVRPDSRGKGRGIGRIGGTRELTTREGVQHGQ